VVGHGQRRLPHPGRRLEQGPQPGGPVEHRILGVYVQMYERPHAAEPIPGVRHFARLAA
jgi:hypothetical protein